MKIVLVYLGSKIPKYARKNLKYLAHSFPNREFVLLVDHAKNYSSKSMRNVKVIRISDPSITWKSGNVILKNSPGFKNDFWYKTIARFKAIEEYMKSNDECSLHIESDVLLSHSFPFALIESISQNFAFPLINDNQGIASLLYIKNYDAAKLLVNFAEQILARNAKYTDMDILGLLYKEREQDVCVLPTIDSELMLLADSFKNHCLDIGRHASKFNGVFDAATLGQYFFGLDRIHTNGFLKTRVYLPHHYLDPRNIRLVIDEGSYYALINDKRVAVYNLHLHSKVEKFFSDSSINLRQFLMNENSGRFKNFSILAYYNSKIYIIAYQFKKLNNFWCLQKAR